MKIISKEVELIALTNDGHDTSCLDTEPFDADTEDKADGFEVFVRYQYDQPLPESGCDWDICEEYEFPTYAKAIDKREELESEIEKEGLSPCVRTACWRGRSTMNIGPSTGTYRYECFGETLEYAESLGFDSDTAEAEMMENEGGEYTPSVADGLEEAAIEFIRDKGVKVIMEEK